MERKSEPIGLFFIQHFDDLTPHRLYDILKLRHEVFGIEQNCIYVDCDGKDLQSYHLTIYKDDLLAGYARILPPGVSYKEWSIGRIVTSPKARGTGIGKEIIKRSLEFLEIEQNSKSARISAQEYLEKFYGDFGFQKVSEPYLEDDIPHIEMLWSSAD